MVAMPGEDSASKQDASLFIGVDVGSFSVRAGLFDATGRLLSSHTSDISVASPRPFVYEQSSDQIWSAVCTCVKNLFHCSSSPCSSDADLAVPDGSAVAVDHDGVEPDEPSLKERVEGIGFDATCSLVLVAKDGQRFNLQNLKAEPAPAKGDEKQFISDVIMWMDHRAPCQAQRINDTADTKPTSKYLGGTISQEMQGPKILWLKENTKPDDLMQVQHMFDLPDFLTWKATGSTSRSLCSLVCKWGLLPHEDGSFGWDPGYIQTVLGLKLPSELKMIGADGATSLLAPGEPVGNGLSLQAADQLGLTPGIKVGTSMIDAHCGCLGSIGAKLPIITAPPRNFTRRLVIVCGTSSCHLTVTTKELFVPGVWGPYKNVVLPGYWTHEGGQSASGQLITHLLLSHPAGSNVSMVAEKAGMHPQEYLSRMLQELADGRQLPVGDLTKNIHIYPDFHGNRSPLADPQMTGMICGLTMDTTDADLALQYLATVQALTYSTRFIMETMAKAGYEPFDELVMCGGLSQGSLFLQTHADALGIPVLVPQGNDGQIFSPVLLGAAMLAATASGEYSNLETAVREMAPNAKVFTPERTVYAYHDAKYRVFRKMIEHQREYKRIMDPES